MWRSTPYFRAQRADGKGWVVGYLVRFHKNFVILDFDQCSRAAINDKGVFHCNCHEIDRDTLNACSGYNFKLNNTTYCLYEEDVVQVLWKGKTVSGVVVVYHEQFMLYCRTEDPQFIPLYMLSDSTHEIPLSYLGTVVTSPNIMAEHDLADEYICGVHKESRVNKIYPIVTAVELSSEREAKRLSDDWSVFRLPPDDRRILFDYKLSEAPSADVELNLDNSKGEKKYE